MIQHRACVRIVAREFLGRLQHVAAVGTGLVIRKHRARSFKLMVDFRDRHDIAVARKHRRHSANRLGHLKDLAVENNSRIPARRGWANDVCPHWSVWSSEFYKFILDHDHWLAAPSSLFMPILEHFSDR